MSDQPKCEACGLQGTAEYIRVRTTNGGLLLCTRCLRDINRKNPIVRKITELAEELMKDSFCATVDRRLIAARLIALAEEGRAGGSNRSTDR